MAEPNCAITVEIQLERDLCDIMVKTCGAEMRSKLIMTCLRMGLLLRDVRNHTVNQIGQQRCKGPGGNNYIFNTGKHRMLSKLSDSRKSEESLRKERNIIRKRLEEKLQRNESVKVMKKLKLKVQRIKGDIKVKHSMKVSRYKKEKEDEELAELANLREELGEFGDLKVLRGINIQPEKRKPPVKSKEVTLSKFEEEVLSKNPQFAVRSMMSKERFMAEFEKGLCKKQYGDMDKEVVNGVAVEEEPIDAEDERIMKEAEWQARKS